MRIFRRIAAAVLVSVTAAADTTMTFDGRGWGHGRGMSQHGAQGYATQGWTFDRILHRYYGGTGYGPASGRSGELASVDPGYVRVNLVANNNAEVITVAIASTSSLKIVGATHTMPASDKAVQLRRNGSTWDVYSRPSVSDPTWIKRGTGGRIVTVGRATGQDLLELHNSQGITKYPGSIRGFTDGLKHRTLNITTAEEYLRGVVPKEIPAAWHAEALKVQAVAARSYLLAGDVRHVDNVTGGYYADTCDTTMCQVYGGHVRNGERVTQDRTDAAVAATAGQVMIRQSNGSIARTEFSSSSGGWTAGGAFPAVEDLGDSVSPRHTWRCVMSTANVSARWGGGSPVTGIDVVERNNVPAAGAGRARAAVVQFANGSTVRFDPTIAQRTIEHLRTQLQGTCTDRNGKAWPGQTLWSDWFFPACGSDQTEYLDATFRLFVQRAPSAGEHQDWCARAATPAGRQELTHALSLTDEWAGVQIRALYEKILDRSLDSSGYAYWMDKVRAGVPIEQIAAYFYGGSEYFTRAGSTNARFLDRLYVDLLGRSSDSTGRGYWLPLLDSGQLSRTEVATNFYASIESRTTRVHGLYRQILSRQADSAGLEYWTDQLLRTGDIALASYLAASDEYYGKVT